MPVTTVLQAANLTVVTACGRLVETPEGTEEVRRGVVSNAQLLSKAFKGTVQPKDKTIYKSRLLCKLRSFGDMDHRANKTTNKKIK